MPPVRVTRKSDPPRPRRAAFPAGVLSLLLLAAVFIAYLVHSISSPKPTGTAQAPLQSLPAATWYRLYFTHPQESNLAGPDQPLSAAILSAQHSVDIAIYSLSLTDVRDALLSAFRRGVSVRLVMESDNLEDAGPQELVNGGIQIVGDRREGLMHNKFAVIDGQEVWTGSMNFTTNGAYADNNNLIAIRSAQLAEDYTTEFEEMFLDDHFGPGSPANTPYPELAIDGTKVEVYFSPDDGVAAHLKSLLAGAKKSIYIMAYSFTSKDLVETILNRADQGVKVAGVMEKDQIFSNQAEEYYSFRNAGLEMRMDGNPGLMHHKVIIVDGKAVAFGSYNFSASAEQTNDENLLIIYDGKLAQRFMEEFQQVYAQATENP
ncbi:MAG: phospholipase D-like domain-containing protein [Chloroflexi bacterium]|nr:phospholipase D-like domain-containing protein [Chloroflexota bacterium]